VAKLEGSEQSLPVHEKTLSDEKFLSALNDSDAAGNLACFHPYLSPSAWSKLSDKVMNSDLTEAKFLWVCSDESLLFSCVYQDSGFLVIFVLCFCSLS